MAAQCATDYPSLRVVLLDRIPRLDSTTREALGKGADQVTASLWEENGRPDNIILESLKLHAASANEKQEIFGRQVGKRGFDIHLRGEKGGKEFTFRAGRLLERVFSNGRSEEDRTKI